MVTSAIEVPGITSEGTEAKAKVVLPTSRGAAALSVARVPPLPAAAIAENDDHVLANLRCANALIIAGHERVLGSVDRTGQVCA